MPTPKLLLPAAVLALLSACQSMPQQSPDQIVRHSINRQFTQDIRYNFSGSLNIVLQKAAAPAAANNGETRSELIDRAANQLVSRLFASTNISYTGAVDLPQGKIELVPELVQKTERNFNSSIKLPLQVDLNSRTLYADPEALSYYFDPMIESMGMQPFNGKLARITLPESWRNRIPVKTLWTYLPQAADAAYASIPAENYTVMPPDELSRSLNAAYRIRVTMNEKQSGIFLAAMLGSLKHNLQHNAWQDNIGAEDKQRVLDALEHIPTPEITPSAIKKTNRYSVQAAAGSHSGNTLRTDFYINRQGQLLATDNTVSTEMDSSKYGTNQLILHYQTRINYRTPVFTLSPTAENSVDYSCLLDDAKKCSTLPNPSQNAR